MRAKTIVPTIETVFQALRKPNGSPFADSEIARQLGARATTVASWRKGEVTPSPINYGRLISMAKEAQRAARRPAMRDII